MHYCVTYREVSVDGHTATETQTLKKAQGSRKAGRKPKENGQKPQKPTETQGPCPKLKGFCIKAFTPAPGGGPGASNYVKNLRFRHFTPLPPLPIGPLKGPCCAVGSCRATGRSGAQILAGWTDPGPSQKSSMLGIQTIPVGRSLGSRTYAVR